MKKKTAKKTGIARNSNGTKTPTDLEDSMPDDALASAVARGKERYGTAKKTGPGVAIPSPDLPPDTNDSFDRALEDLKVIFKAAALGSKDAMRNLFTFAWKATADLVALNELEGTRMGIESASPLVERQATLSKIMQDKTAWPALMHEKQKDAFESVFKASLTMLRPEIDGTRDESKQVEIVTAYLAPKLKENPPERLKKRMASVGKKRRTKAIAQLENGGNRKRLEKQKTDDDAAGIVETRIIQLNTKIENLKKTEHGPTDGVLLESLKDLSREELRRMSPEK